MPRLIDAQQFELRVSQRKMTEVFPNWKDLPDETKDLICKLGQYIHTLLKAQPTVNAAEVVRCRDCKHYKSYGPGLDGFETFGKCLLISMDVDMPVGGYCCYGERSEDCAPD